MIKDALGNFGNSISAIQNVGGPTLIGDYIDLEAHLNSWGASRTPDIGEAGDLWVNVKVTTTLVGASSTAVFALYHHTAAGVASGAALVTSADVGESAAGTTVLRHKIPAGTCNRYLGICLTVGTQNQTAGAIDAWIGDTGETPK